MMEREPLEMKGIMSGLLLFDLQEGMVCVKGSELVVFPNYRDENRLRVLEIKVYLLF